MPFPKEGRYCSAGRPWGRQRPKEKVCAGHYDVVSVCDVDSIYCCNMCCNLGPFKVFVMVRTTTRLRLQGVFTRNGGKFARWKCPPKKRFGREYFTQLHGKIILTFVGTAVCSCIYKISVSH